MLGRRPPLRTRIPIPKTAKAAVITKPLGPKAYSLRKCVVSAKSVRIRWERITATKKKIEQAIDTVAHLAARAAVDVWMGEGVADMGISSKAFKSV